MLWLVRLSCDGGGGVPATARKSGCCSRVYSGSSRALAGKSCLDKSGPSFFTTLQLCYSYKHLVREDWRVQSRQNECLEMWILTRSLQNYNQVTKPTTGCSKIFLAVLLVNWHIGTYNTLYHHISIIMIHPRIVFDLSLSLSSRLKS